MILVKPRRLCERPVKGSPQRIFRLGISKGRKSALQHCGTRKPVELWRTLQLQQPVHVVRHQVGANCVRFTAVVIQKAVSDERMRFRDTEVECFIHARSCYGLHFIRNYTGRRPLPIEIFPFLFREANHGAVDAMRIPSIQQHRSNVAKCLRGGESVHRAAVEDTAQKRVSRLFVQDAESRGDFTFVEGATAHASIVKLHSTEAENALAVMDVKVGAILHFTEFYEAVLRKDRMLWCTDNTKTALSLQLQNCFWRGPENM